MPRVSRRTVHDIGRSLAGSRVGRGEATILLLHNAKEVIELAVEQDEQPATNLPSNWLSTRKVLLFREQVLLCIETHVHICPVVEVVAR